MTEAVVRSGGVEDAALTQSSAGERTLGSAIRAATAAGSAMASHGSGLDDTRNITHEEASGVRRVSRQAPPG